MKTFASHSSFVILFLLVTTLIACGDRQGDRVISFNREDFKEQKALKGRILEFDSLIMQPLQIQAYDSLLITYNVGVEKLFHIFNLNTGHKIGERITIGQGPKEMMSPCFVNRTDSVVLFDMMTSTVFSYSIPEFVNNEDPDFSSRVSFEEKPLWSNIRYLGNGFITAAYQAESPCYLFNKQGKRTMDFGTYPLPENSYKEAELMNAFRLDLTSNAKDKIATTYYFTDIIQIYDTAGILQKQLSGPDHFASVFKEVRNGNIITSKADPKTYRDVYYSPVSVGDQIFVLYNGKMVEDPDYNLLCKELFVIGWDGSLICRYTLDQGVSNITVDSQHRKIYGISDDPEYHIVEFEY